MKFSTIAIRAHQDPDPITGAVIPPIYQTSTFEQEDAGVHKGFEYSRTGNPTVDTLAKVLTELEGGTSAYCFASGVGALVTLCNAMLSAGDHMILGDVVYGGTYRYTTKVLSRFGVDVEFVDMGDPENVRNTIRPNTKLVYMETPGNPTLKVVDIAAINAIAKEKNIPTVVDNTFASPYLQSPFAHGVDIILHSTTKYIGGHSDVIGGALVLRDNTYDEVMRFHRNTVGAIPDPFNSWLTLRGVKTLAARMGIHCKNAQAVAEFLEKHPAVENVIYPGLPSHPQHALAKKQMKNGFGGMVTFRIKGGMSEASRFLKGTKIFTLAESLGGVESLLCFPAAMTHKSVDPKDRAIAGITDNLIRISVGIEDIDDLIADLDASLKQAVSTAGATR